MLFNPEAVGIVFDLQRYSVHDGPGIRTIVFLKGCPLACRWCSNPESQHGHPEITFMSRNCIGCKKCLEACPRGAVDFAEPGRINRGKCDHCGKCTEVCNANALTLAGRPWKVKDVLAELAKDSIQYRRSGGGITLSGGEALAQPNFVEELLKGCKSKGWHTAIETTGFAPAETLKRILPLLDLVMLDIKHMDPQKHRTHIGQTNDLVLQNARLIADSGVPLIIRIPVIPGFNDDPINIRATANLAVSLGKVKEIHLLPYHRLGQMKYGYMDREYLMEGVKPPNREEIADLQKIVQSFGIPCSIGGH